MQVWLDLNINLLAGSKKKPGSITAEQFFFAVDPIDGRLYVYLSAHQKHGFSHEELSVRLLVIFFKEFDIITNHTTFCL